MGPTPRKLRGLALGALALAALASPWGPAQAGGKPPGKRDARAEKKVCVEAHTQGQSLQREGKLAAAREEFITCGRETCPGAIRKECAALLAEVQESQPSVVIEARDELGRPTTDVKVFVDGEEIAASLTGRALEVDPGQHSFRYVSARGTTLEQTELILEGQRNRKLTAVFGHAPPPPPPPPRGVPTASYVLGGLGAAALGSFVVFGLVGKAKQGELEDTCAPRCAQGDADAMRRHYLVADLSLGVAALALGAAVVIAVIQPGETPAPAAASLVLRPGGAAAPGASKPTPAAVSLVLRPGSVAAVGHF